MTALAFQHAGGGCGSSPTIYANAAAFTDVTGTPPTRGTSARTTPTGSTQLTESSTPVRTFDQDSRSLTVGPGRDDVTGLGSPNTGWLTATG